MHVLNIETVKTPRWDNFEHLSFTCIVKYKEFEREYPVGVSPSDPHEHIQQLWVNGTAGKYGVIAEFVERSQQP